MAESARAGDSDEVYVTVAVTPLAAGWRNVFDEGRDGSVELPCPAVLLQECRATVRYVDAHVDGHVETTPRLSRCQTPYQTRVVFADWADGHLVPALEKPSYRDTLPPPA